MAGQGLDLLDSRPASPRAPLGTAFVNAALLVLAACAVATVIALLIRLMRSRGVEHQQLKWLTYAGAFAVLGLLLLLPGDVWSGSQAGSLDLAGAVLTAGGVLGFRSPWVWPSCATASFDIDVLIARTVVYGLLSAAFTVIYLAMVVGIGTLIGSGVNPTCCCRWPLPA